MSKRNLESLLGTVCTCAHSHNHYVILTILDVLLIRNVKAACKNAFLCLSYSCRRKLLSILHDGYSHILCNF